MNSPAGETINRPHVRFNATNTVSTALKHKRNRQPSVERGRASAPARRVGLQAQQPSDAVHVKKSKTESKFVELRRSLVDAPAIAGYIQENYNAELRDPKQLNNFFQAVSNRPEVVFTELCGKYKTEVCLLLERMLEVYSTVTSRVSVPIPSAAHEFIIRCEQNGVRKSSWAEDLAQADGSEDDARKVGTESQEEDIDNEKVVAVPRLLPTLLFSPRELIKKVASVEPRGRLGRMIEMSSTISDLSNCARKLRAIATTARECEKGLDYATVCQLISKLASKARRTCEAVLRTGTPHSVDENAGKLSEEDLTALDSVIDILLFVTQHSFTTRPRTVQQHPIAKLTNFVKWCDARSLLQVNAAKHSAAIEALEKLSTNEMHAQAAQLETVLLLKALQPGDDGAAADVLKRLWDESLGRYEPCSADVLSSIAVVCGAAGISGALRIQVAQRLILTQQCVQRERGSTETVLPRRALNFVLAEQSKKKRDAVKQMLAKEETEKGKKG